MLKRNRFGFRMRKRSLSGRLFQFLVVLTVVSLFIYLLLYSSNFSKDFHGVDFMWLKSRNLSEYLKPDVNTLILEPSHPICKSVEKKRLLVAVHSHPGNYERRRIIRNTWAREIKSYPGVSVIFMLGQSPKALEKDVFSEATKYDDLVQEDFVDSFVNLTLKTTFLLKWISSNECLTAKFLFKTDDDTFVNPSLLWTSLEHSLLHSATTKSLLPFFKQSIVGEKLNGIEASLSFSTLSESIDYLVMGKVMATVPIRDMGHKLYLPTKFYPLNIFPLHVSGSGYVVSMSIVPMLYECMLRTPFMNLEDVMLTGLCATTQMGLKMTNNDLFRPKKPSVAPDYVCYYKKSALVHGLDISEMREMWVKSKEELNCDTFYFDLIMSMTSFVEMIKQIFRFD